MKGQIKPISEMNLKGRANQRKVWCKLQQKHREKEKKSNEQMVAESARTSKTPEPSQAKISRKNRSAGKIKIEKLKSVNEKLLPSRKRTSDAV